jgi:hypothetical protein
MNLVGYCTPLTQIIAPLLKPEPLQIRVKFANEAAVVGEMLLRTGAGSLRVPPTEAFTVASIALVAVIVKVWPFGGIVEGAVYSPFELMLP